MLPVHKAQQGQQGRKAHRDSRVTPATQAHKVRSAQLAHRALQAQLVLQAPPDCKDQPVLACRSAAQQAKCWPRHRILITTRSGLHNLAAAALPTQTSKSSPQSAHPHGLSLLERSLCMWWYLVVVAAVVVGNEEPEALSMVAVLVVVGVLG